MAGGVRRQAARLDAAQGPVGLREHDTARGGPGREARVGRRGQARGRPHGHPHRRLPALHPEHLRRHPLHSADLGRRHGRRHTGLPHRIHLLLRREYYTSSCCQ